MVVLPWVFWHLPQVQALVSGSGIFKYVIFYLASVFGA